MAAAGTGHVIGIDLGGTNLQAAVVSPDHSILGRHWCRTLAHEGFDAVIDRIEHAVHSACEQANVAIDDIAAIGIGSPGAIDSRQGVVLESPNLGWKDVPLRKALCTRLKLPVKLDNDVNAAVWGEYQLGAGRGCSALLGVWVGTGVGGALVINDQRHHGPNDTAGEIGHTVIDCHGHHGRRTVEDLCSRRGMGRLIDPTDDLAVDTAVIAKAFAGESDSNTGDIVNRGADLLGIAIANIVTMLSLDRVVIGGGVAEALGEPYRQRVHASFQADVFPARLRACEIVLTELASTAGLLGAAMLAREAMS